MALLVGLTGGIGSGKSTVAGLFSALGVPCLDADDVARAVVLPGTPALKAIVKRFGTSVVDAQGNLDRAALRRVVFADVDARRDLEAIVHPAVRAHMSVWARSQREPYSLWVVPLLFETGMDKLTDQTLVVDLPTDVQRERVARRDGHTPEEAQRIMDTQWPRDRRIQVADQIIDNGASVEALNAQVARLHGLFLALAGGSDHPPMER